FFTCVACASSHSMQAKSIKKHSKSPSHLKHLEQWLAQHAATAAASTTQTDSCNHEKKSDSEVDLESQDDQVHLYIGDIADVDMDEDFEKHQKSLVDLWTKDHTAIFNNPVHHVSSSEGHSPAPSVNSSQDNRVGNHSNSGSQPDLDDQCSQEGIIVEDESSWAPFSSLEAGSTSNKSMC
ncbi:hypothetical protein DFH28DRAFT_899390, partial [Melampsora americana]